MKFLKCKKCQGTDFKLNIFHNGISVICSHCMNEIEKHSSDSFHDLDDCLDIVEISD